MALTRKFLAAMGIEADKIDQIVEANQESLEAIKGERDQYKADLEKYKPDAEKHTEVQKELDDLKNANANNPYKEKYETEHTAFEQYKQEISEKELKAKKVAAYKALLKEAGVSEKRIDAIVKVSAVDDVELDENGIVKDADALKETIKKEWSDFIQTQGASGADVPNPPENGGGTPLSRAAQVAKRHYEAVYGTKGDSK